MWWSYWVCVEKIGESKEFRAVLICEGQCVAWMMIPQSRTQQATEIMFLLTAKLSGIIVNFSWGKRLVLILFLLFEKTESITFSATDYNWPDFQQNGFVNCIFSLPAHCSWCDGTIVAIRLTFCPCPVKLLWVALSIYFHFIRLTQQGVSANTTSVMAANRAPVLEGLTKTTPNLCFGLFCPSCLPTFITQYIKAH